MSSGSLSSRSGGAWAGRKQSSGLVTSTARYSASSSQLTQAVAENSSDPGYGSSLRRYWSSRSSRSGSAVSKPSSVPSSAGGRSTRSAVPVASVGRSSSSSGCSAGTGGGARAGEPDPLRADLHF